MSILIPVHDAYQQDATVELHLAGSTDLQVSGSVALHAPVVFAGATNLAFFPTRIVSGQINLIGATAISVSGRLNADADVSGQVEFDGSTLITFSAGNSRTSPILFAGQTDLQVDGFVQAASSFGFTVFVDVTDAALQAALQPDSNIRRYRARLVVDGTEIPIIRASLQAPSDKLGTELTVVLADPNISAVTVTSLINFDIAIWVANAWVWISLLTGGRLSQRAARYINEENLPKDAVELTIVDIIGDRWNRAPRQQIFMYDSQMIDPPTQEAIISERIYNTTGGIFEPVFFPLPGMTFLDVLNYAYINGCGFTKIITNIQNFPVEQASFTVTGGYDAGVRSLLEMFSPVVFASGNDIWIVDPDQPLPSGISTIDFVAAFSASIDDTLPAHEPINGLLVRLNDALAGAEYFTERLETSTVTNGLLGDTGYTEIDTERRIREHRTFGNPTVIVREEVVYVKTRTLNHNFDVISQETRTDHFGIVNRALPGGDSQIQTTLTIPTGYTQSIELLVPDINDPDLGLALQEVTREEQLITYIPDPLHPLQLIQSRIETRVEGLILVDGNNQYLGSDYKIPYLDAHKSGYISGSGQSTEFGSIRTVIEQLTFNGGQVRYETRTINHLANIPDKTTIKTLPGSSQVSLKNSGQFKYVLLTVPGTDATSRRVAEFDGTQLPYSIALAIAQRRLNNLNNPPKEIAVNMAYVNPSLRRGAVIHVAGRSGYLGNYILKGYTITVEAVELKNYHASMSFSARELKVT